MKHAPLLRHSTLKPFSRDHHTGLVHANRMVRSAESDSEARRLAVVGFLDAWRAELAQHFADEERLLLSFMIERDVQRLETEHAQLRALVAAAPERVADSTLDPNWIRHLGQLLYDHIRWEERELFPLLQDTAGRHLDELKSEGCKIEASRQRAEQKGRRAKRLSACDQEKSPCQSQ